MRKVFNFRQTINRKLLLYILPTTFLIFAVTFGTISYRAHKLAISESEIILKTTAQKYATTIEKELNSDLATVRTLAQAFSVVNTMEPEKWKPLFLSMYYEVFKNSPQFYKLWDSWELKHIDSTWQKDYGRLAYTIYRTENKIKHSETLRSVDGDNKLYAWNKTNFCDLLWEPYWDAYVEQSEVKKFMTSISSPITINNQFGGMVAVDLTMDRFQHLIEFIKPFEQSNSFLASNEGVYVGHPNQRYIGNKISEMDWFIDEEFQLSEKIKAGACEVFWGTDEDKNQIAIAIAPIKVGEINTPWSVGIMVPRKVILAEAYKTQNITIVISILGLVLLAFVIRYVSKQISHSLNVTTKVIEKLATGNTDIISNLELNTGDEIDKMAESVNHVIEGIKRTSDFAKEMGVGNLDADFKPLSENDVLGNSLLDMRKSLQHARMEEEARKKEDEKLHWINQGIARFSEILRTNSSNLKEMSGMLLTNLVNYLGVNQGAIFVINDDDSNKEPMLEMVSAVAYDRQKFIKKTIEIGEGLVGRCAFERKTIYLTDIPQDYIQITSGLGTSNPSAVLLVPLVLNDEVFGVVELASFQKFEPFQIEFIEKLGESIASTISSVKINEKTSTLLKQSKIQAEELASQEEEMRQNLEELQATQEEAARREFEMSGIIKALSSTAFTVEYDLDGNIISVNDKYANLLNTTSEHLVGQHHSTGYELNASKQMEYQSFWNELKKGISKKEVNQIKFNGSDIWIEETYIPITASADDKPYKILKIGFDVTEKVIKERQIKEQAQKLNEQIEQLKSSEFKIKKEMMMVSEYRSQIKELQAALDEKNHHLETLKATPVEQKPIETIKPLVNSKTQSSPTKREYIKWEPKYLTGIKEIDEQHEQLFSLSNKLYLAFEANKGKKETKDLFRSFIDFTDYHFGAEESYFEEFGFDTEKVHVNEHRHFIKALESYFEQYSANQLKSATEMFDFIQNWLDHHILKMDSQYNEVFKRNIK